MFRAPAVAILAVILSGGAFGQSAAVTPPAFEVASIKPAPPQAPGRVSTRMSVDSARLAYTNVSLRDVIVNSYHVQESQILGPAWLDTQRFDILARFPPGATRDQTPQMLQTLLADRFQLKLHQEQRVLTVYSLTVGKNGPKLRKAESSSGLGGGITPRHAHVSGKASMARFAAYLSTRLGQPVQDQTGLDGDYAIDLDWIPDAVETPAPGDAPGEAGPSIFTAVQEQLGLKLTGRKGPVEVLVIDHVEKLPTGN